MCSSTSIHPAGWDIPSLEPFSTWQWFYGTVGEHNLEYISFIVLTSFTDLQAEYVSLNTTVFCDMIQYGPVEVYRRFRGTCCFHYLPWWWQSSYSKTSVLIYDTTWRHVQGDQILLSHRDENFKSFWRPAAHPKFFAGTGRGTDPEAIYKLCLILKIML